MPRMRRRLRSATLPLHRHSFPQLVVDGLLVALAYYLAFQLRFDGGPAKSWHAYAVLRDRTIWWAVGVALVVFVLGGVYQRNWRYAGQRDLEAIVRAAVVATVLVVVAVAVVHPVEVSRISGRVETHLRGEIPRDLPNGVIAMYFLFILAFVCGVRVLGRAFHEGRLSGLRSRSGGRTVLIVGAGDGGRQVLREIMRNPALGLRPVGFVDDDPRKRGVRYDGVQVRGTTHDMPRLLDDAEPDEVIIAIPSAPGTTRARVARACRDQGIPVRTLPTVFELLQGDTVVRQMREVRVEDVLGREPVTMALDRVGAYLAGETVMVTGAGGSIGSELCRQIARVRPRRIVLVDHAEDNLFRIQRELEDERQVHPSLLLAILADCKEEQRMREVFAEHRPTVVFHAAAYKHVGLMESNPVEAVANNAIGTRLVARIAGQSGVRRMVLVSTDKAVAPSSVMGASKALAEWALEAESVRWPNTRYAAVRFGNVLGSSGSVVPIFRRQIASGGPVTITDRRMRRYFMTIPEAVQLIIRSGALVAEHSAPGAQVFVLDMGEPVLIVDLARAMIELSGLRPDRDIAIETIGSRPGEKLDEELFNSYERSAPSAAERIFVAERVPLDQKSVEDVFDQVNLLVLEGDAAGLAAKVTELSALRGAPGELAGGLQGSRGGEHPEVARARERAGDLHSADR
jgi:FlaA1/EpsC-like NDP-sugar epimerase